MKKHTALQRLLLCRGDKCLAKVMDTPPLSADKWLERKCTGVPGCSANPALEKDQGWEEEEEEGELFLQRVPAGTLSWHQENLANACIAAPLLFLRLP